MKNKILIFIHLLFMTIGAVSPANESVKNTHNLYLNDPAHVNPHPYYIDENGERIRYASDAGRYNIVTMSNGYNAYGIQNGEYIDTNESKTHPSFWNDSFFVVDAKDSSTSVRHGYTKRTQIGEFLFHNPYNDWLKKTTYRILDFLSFKNTNQFHKDLWGFKIQLFYISANNDSNNESDNDSSLSNTSLKNCTNTNIFDIDKNQSKARLDQTKNNEKSTHKSYEQSKKKLKQSN